MGLVGGRWWRWLRGDGPLEILPARPLPAAVAWLFALVLAWAIGATSPQGQAALHAALSLGLEALLTAVTVLVAGRRNLLAQALQAAGLLAGLRNLVLAPVLALLFADKAQAGPGTILALFVPLALVTVAAMAWLVRRYLVLWQQALRIKPAMAGVVLLGLALALLCVEALLAQGFPGITLPAQASQGAAVAASLR